MTRRWCPRAVQYLERVSHLNSADTPEIWKPDDIRTVLRDLAAFHAIYLDRYADLIASGWIDAPSHDRMVKMKPLWRELLEHNCREFPDMWTLPRRLLCLRAIENISFVWHALEAAPRTLIHNDFNPRNLCLRVDSAGGRRLCAYDWELYVGCRAQPASAVARGIADAAAAARPFMSRSTMWRSSLPLYWHRQPPSRSVPLCSGQRGGALTHADTPTHRPTHTHRVL